MVAYARKEQELCVLEAEYQREHFYDVKNRVLYAWAMLVQRRVAATKFVRRHQLNIMKGVLNALVDHSRR